MIKRVIAIAEKVRGHYARDGALGASHRLFGKWLEKTGRTRKIDIASDYAFVHAEPFGDPAEGESAPKNSLTWVVPDVGVGSGGHLSVFRFISHLEKNGFDCHITVAGHSSISNASDLKQMIDRHFLPLGATVSIGTLKAAHTTVATAWQTAYCVRDFRGTVNKCYFVQDFEPWFFPAGSDASFAEQTYRFGFRGITAGNWLAEKLARDYQMKTTPVGFSYERELHRRHPRRDASHEQVFFYARPSTSRRAFELGVLALDALHRRRPQTTFVLAGWDLRGYKIPFPHRDLGVLARDQLSPIYSQCDAALVISLSNVSLLPIELMASGCPVVSNRGPQVEWLLNDNNAKLADATIESLAEALFEVLDDKALQERLIENGLAVAAATTWQAEGEKMAAVFRELGEERLR